MKKIKINFEKKTKLLSKLIEGKKLVLFGYNEIAIYFLKVKLTNICVVDKNFLKKIKIKPSNVKFQQIEDVKNNVIFVNCVTGVSAGLIYEKLTKLNKICLSWITVKNIFNYKDINYWYLGNFDKFFRKNSKNFEEIFYKLNDLKSKKDFLKILNYKVTGNEGVFKYLKNSSPQYIPNFIDFRNINKIVDVGSFDGDTIESLIQNGIIYETLYAIEPDKANFNILQNKFKKNKNICLINKALGLKNEYKYLHSDSDRSKITKHETGQKVSIISLDELKIKPDYIKVDIEGYEYEFIEGARKTIQKYKPKIAICVYHQESDFYSIPKKITELNQNYQIFFRHYSYGFTESVMYFV